MKRRFIVLLSLLCLAMGSQAQQPDSVKKSLSVDSLLGTLSNADDHKEDVVAFKATSLIFSPTTEVVKKNNLNFLVIHRFGDIGTPSGGGQTLFGLDAVNDVYLGFEYGLSDNLNINFGRSTVGQLIELQIKYALLHQTNDDRSPVAITVLAGSGLRPYQVQLFNTFDQRLSFITEAILSRKFNSVLSLEVSPVFVEDEQPIPNLAGNEQGFFSLTAAGRLKVTKHMSILVDYEHPFSAFRNGANGFQDPLGFGAEFETGGHVFTLNFTNAPAISQINTLSNSEASWFRGQYRFGFTISRMFDFNHKY
jgi:hypothetical protein